FLLDTLRSDEVAALIEFLPDWAGESIRDAIAKLPHDLDEVIAIGTERTSIESAQGIAVGAVATGGSIAFHTIMMLIALFFFLARGKELVEWIDRVSPLRHGQTLELLDAF